MSTFTSIISNPQLTEGSNPDESGYATNKAVLEDSVGNRYYVTMAQLTNGAQGNPQTTPPYLMIYKSVDRGVTWTTLVADSDRGSDNGFGACIVNDVIHIAIANANVAPNSRLGMYRYNTLTNLFLADDYGGPGRSDGQQATCSLSDGSVTIAYLSLVGGTMTNDVKIVNWKAGVWSTPVGTGSGDLGQMQPQWLIKEKTTERVHLFLYGIDVLVPGLWHVSLEADGTTINTLQLITTTATFPFTGIDFGRIGQPCIKGSDAQLNCPYIAGPFSGLNTLSLRITRGDVSANPTWTDEEVVSATTISNTQMAVQSGFNYFVCSSVCKATGVITVFFQEENQNNPPANTQSWIYQVSSSSLIGGWGAPAILYTGPSNTSGVGGLGAIGVSIYGSVFADDTFGVVSGTIDIGDAPILYNRLALFFIGEDVPNPNPSPLPSPCAGEVRLQIFDDGVGEYVADLPLSTLLIGGDNGVPFYLPSPLAINKRGLLTVSLANVQSTNESVNAHIALMFAVPKKSRWKDLKS